MSLRDVFLEALEKNEDDHQTRMVFADWLDDQGEHDEAGRHRLWPTAKKWLVEFCEKHNPQLDEEDEPYREEMERAGYFVTYPELVQMALDAVEAGDDDIEMFFSNEDMCMALYDHCDMFWKNWSIVTGHPLPIDVETRSNFRCAC